MKRTLLATALLLGTAPAGAVFRDKDAGTAAAQFLKLGADARAEAMGEAVDAVSEDANSVYWNPAGLAGLKYRHATVTHGAYFQDVFYDYLAYAQPVPSLLGERGEREIRENQLGAFGIAALYLNAGKIAELDNMGAPTGDSFTPQDLAVMAGWGMALTRTLDIGLGGKYISSRIQQDSANAGAFDAGARLHFLVFDMPYVLSAGIHNLGGRVKFIEQEDPVPLTLTVGNSLRPTKDWIIAFDMVAPRDNDPYPALGTEYRFTFDPELSTFLRAGYTRRTGPNDLGGLTGLSIGGGISFSRFGIDYAWVPYGLLGDTHRFSLSYRF